MKNKMILENERRTAEQCNCGGDVLHVLKYQKKINTLERSL